MHTIALKPFGGGFFSARRATTGGLYGRQRTAWSRTSPRAPRISPPSPASLVQRGGARPVAPAGSGGGRGGHGDRSGGVAHGHHRGGHRRYFGVAGFVL